MPLYTQKNKRLRKLTVFLRSLVIYAFLSRFTSSVIFPVRKIIFKNYNSGNCIDSVLPF